MSFLKSWFPNLRENGGTLQDLFGEFLGTLPDSALVVGGDMRILASNNAAYDAFGRGNDPLSEKRLTEVIRDLTLHDAFRSAIETRRSSEIQLELLGNEVRKYEVRVSPVTIGDSKAAIGYFRDITHVDRLERVREEFLSNVSHELRTPLTSIMAFVETLEDGALNDRENNLRFLQVIHRNAERMHRLIDDILELSAIESGNVALERRPCRLHAMVNETFTALSGRAKEHGVELRNEVPENACVKADPVRLEQMLVNLVDNGIKFNREGGRVAVSYSQGGGTDVISISDNGEGIAPEHLPRLFERFYRTDRARSREIGGTGLGLAICKHLTILHGGEISVASTVGEGSTFKIELPRN